MLKNTIERPQVTIKTLLNLKATGEKAAMLSINDFPFAQLAEAAGLDIIIVGDSLAMTKLGYKNTLPVTMDEMITYSSAVRRGTDKVFIVGDMPFMSYQVSDKEAIASAGRFIKEAGCEAVKCEASLKLIPRIKAIAEAEILVMGHVGLNPQKIHEMGGYRIQGKTLDSTKNLLETALALEDAGVFAILLEGVTDEVSGLIHKRLKIPVYGIGSGKNLDGYLLIAHDPLGLYFGFEKIPSYVKQYKPTANGDKTVGDLILDVFKNYVEDIKSGNYPKDENVHHVEADEWETIKKEFPDPDNPSYE